MSLTFVDIAVATLKKAQEPLTPSEIWDKSGEWGLRGEFESTSKNPVGTISARIYQYIEANGEKSQIYRASSNPVKYDLTERKNAYVKPTDAGKTDSQKRDYVKHEYFLHPLLVRFIADHRHFRAHAKTIPHQNSKQATKGENRWRYPDIVGVHFPFIDLKNVLWMHKESAVNLVKFYSFELKTSLDSSDLRQAYFQAVSNSSWAHEGYLVALNIDIDKDNDLLEECRRLNKAFGIGIIKLNSESVIDSEILFHARSKETADWDTMDSLAAVNPEFQQFLKSINNAIATKEIIAQNFDEIIKDDNDMKKYIETFVKVIK